MDAFIFITAAAVSSGKERLCFISRSTILSQSIWSIYLIPVNGRFLIAHFLSCQSNDDDTDMPLTLLQTDFWAHLKNVRMDFNDAIINCLRSSTLFSTSVEGFPPKYIIAAAPA